MESATAPGAAASSSAAVPPSPTLSPSPTGRMFSALGRASFGQHSSFQGRGADPSKEILEAEAHAVVSEVRNSNVLSEEPNSVKRVLGGVNLL